MSLALLACCLLGVNGAVYVAMGGVMLLGPEQGVAREFATAYASLFKAFRELPSLDSKAPPAMLGTPDLRREIGFRVLSYLLLLMGIFRVLTAFHWECTFVYIGLSTYLSEIAIVCNELLAHESVLLHRGMAVILANVAFSIVYLANALPFCMSH